MTASIQVLNGNLPNGFLGNPIDTYRDTYTYPFCGNSILIAPGTLVAMVAVEGKVPFGTSPGMPGNINCTAGWELV